SAALRSASSDMRPARCWWCAKGNNSRYSSERARATLPNKVLELKVVVCLAIFVGSAIPATSQALAEPPGVKEQRYNWHVQNTDIDPPNDRAGWRKGNGR